METERAEATNNGSQNEEMNLKVPLAVSESYTHAVGVAPTSVLFKDVESHNCTISNSSNLDCPIQFKNTWYKANWNELHLSFNSVTDLKQLYYLQPVKSS